MSDAKKQPRKVERRHHKAERLPESVLTDLNDRLKRGETYEHVEAWLVGLGYPIGKSSIHRYHRWMREGLTAVRDRAIIAEKIVEANADRDPTTVQNATYQLAMQEVMSLLLQMTAGEADLSVNELTKIIHALAAMGGTATNLTKFVREQRRLLAEAEKKASTPDAKELCRKLAEGFSKAYKFRVEPPAEGGTDA